MQPSACRMQKRVKEKGEEEEEKKNEYMCVCKRVFIISYEYISAVFLLRLLDYAMRNDKTNAIDIERKWRVVTVAILASKQ